jgi:putative hydroxymethylpyrimidine transport system ATP-binding protein
MQSKQAIANTMLDSTKLDSTKQPASQQSHNEAIESPDECIDIRGGYLRYLDNAQPTIQKLTMHIPAKNWTCILGKSGCGKSSLLRYLAGLLGDKVEWRGAVSIQNQQTLSAEVHSQIAYMAQQDLLMPWLSVLDNVLLSSQFGEASSLSKEQLTSKALELLEQVGLRDHAQSLPQQLSGGMRQRAALARTLMQDKPIVLMDEPFSALDAVTRHRLQNLACELLKEKTVVLITHDPQEAIRLAGQLYIMSGSPARAVCLHVPKSPTPRKLDAECAQIQQSILDSLERDYE